MAGGKGSVFVGTAAFQAATPSIFFFCGIYAMGSVFFGYDSSSFSGVQAMDPFVRQFGSYNAATGTYALSSLTKSLMNSLPLLGKFLSAAAVGSVIERLGHRWTMVATCLVQIAGAVGTFLKSAERPFGTGHWSMVTK